MLIHKPIVLRSALLSVILTSGWFFQHSRAQADIVVDGADPTWNHNIQDWCDHHIPTAYRTRDHIMVRLLNDRQMTAYLDSGKPDDSSNDRQQHQSPDSNNANDDNDIDGVFEDGPPRVTLRLSGASMPDMFTFAHEYGHYVWFDLLSAADRKHYQAIYQKQRAQKHLVTDYAGTDVEEGFAEAFSFYVAAPTMLSHRDAESSRFLDAWTATHAPTS